MSQHATPAPAGVHTAPLLRDDPAPPIAREGWPLVALFLGGTVALGAALYYWAPPAGYVGWGVGLALSLWCIWFFRDPPRATPDVPGAVVAPADGRVVLVGPAQPPADLKLPGEPAGMQRVCIFMNVFNVHVNRAPVSGEVVAASYHKGVFLNASLDKASDLNERYSLGVRTRDGRLLAVVQIAGLVARRIVCKTGVGRSLRAGERYGLIRFGSRVDVYVPAGSAVHVRIGDRTIAGETVIATLPPPG